MRVATSEEVVTSEEEARRSVVEEVKALEEELKDASPLMIMDKVSVVVFTETETTSETRSRRAARGIQLKVVSLLRLLSDG